MSAETEAAAVAETPVVAAPEAAQQTPAAKTDDTNVDEFASMFASFAKDDKPAAAAATTETPAPAATETAAETVTEPAKAAPAPAPAPAPQQDPMERLADILQQRQPQQQAPMQQQPPALYSQEEASTLQEFYKEWPEIARAQELALRGTSTTIVNHVFTEMARVLAPRLKLLDALADNVTYDNLERRIPDYATVQDKVAEWVNTQPAYLKNAFTGVMQGGTTDEIIDLTERWRAATGQAVAQAAPAATLNTPPALSPAAKQAAARLAPVSGKRTGPTQGAPTTFEDAFDQFAKAG